MQISHVDQGEAIGAGVRGGARDFKTLLVGREKALDNFRVVLARQAGKVSIPRHRHNFDQIRMCLSGGAQNYGRDRWINPGEIVYFPEGTPYGPEESETNRLGITIQFGGASGYGFLSARDIREGTEALKKLGTIDDGVFRRSGPLAPGQSRNRDSFEAVWELINQRRIEYPKARYDDPVHMKPQSFAWQPDTQHRGLARKLLGCFSERSIEISMLSLAPQATARLAVRPGTQIGFVISGSGALDRAEIRTHSAFSLEANECAELVTDGGLELLLLGLPIFERKVAAA